MPVSKYGKSAGKARRSMMKHYGAKKGKQVFYATANKRGRGKSRGARIRSAYKKKG
jgi:hypothetical protein